MGAPLAVASAPAKLILCGEHAVVYGRPAIALPLGDVRAYAEVAPGAPGAGLRFDAPDLGGGWGLDEQPAHPLSELALATLHNLGATAGDLLISLRSDIPIASGMGSGAAIGTALVRALAAHVGRELPPDQVAALVYTSEQRFHGTPSGIDNTVVAYERAIWYVRAQTADERPTTADHATTGTASMVQPAPAPTIEPLRLGARLTLLVGDSGVRSATRLPVGAVRERWQADRLTYETLFSAMGDLAIRARALLAAGETIALGALLDENQTLLEQIGVSSPELGQLVAAARSAGALGAKLSGAGWGGVMLALVTPETAGRVAAALGAAGATRVLQTSVPASARSG